MGAADAAGNFQQPGQMEDNQELIAQGEMLEQLFPNYCQIIGAVLSATMQ